MSETPTTPAPELLSAERLADISAKSCRLLPRILAGFPDGSVMVLIDGIDDLLAHAAAQAEQIRLLTMRADSADCAAAEMQDELAAAEARAAEAEAQVAMLKTELAEREGRADCHCSARSENECTCR